MTRRTARLAMLGLTLSTFFACAKGVTDDGATGAGGFDATEGSGGAGGGAGGADLGPCGTDCSAIQTPACQVATCNETTKQCEVKTAEDGTACEDGLFCTAKDTCVAGACVAGPPNTCAATAPPCNQMKCDEQTKTCFAAPLPNGGSCVPENKCEFNGTCSFGECLGTKNDCDSFFPPDDCHVGVCNPGTGLCESQPGNDGLPCDDAADLCTVSKTCSAGQCVGGKPKDCSALSKGCFNGACDTTNGKCVANPIKPGESCSEATDSCNQGTCDLAGKCVANPINEAKACDDGLACTSNTVCTSGACKGGTSNITVYLFEEFASNAAGWTLDAEWEIGGAAVSSGNVYGNPDPGTDHTVANQNNGVAGVVLGGNASIAQHDFAWLTSPAVDTSQATTLYFEFYRWLNSDYLPYMQNAVEVFDGTKWVNLWITGGSPGVQDAAWAKVTYDLAAYKNAQMRVRFGFKVGSGGAYTVSQWNVDDVLIGSGPCN